jgi:hypothetical protein
MPLNLEEIPFLEAPVYTLAKEQSLIERNEEEFHTPKIGTPLVQHVMGGEQ